MRPREFKCGKRLSLFIVLLATGVYVQAASHVYNQSGNPVSFSFPLIVRGDQPGDPEIDVGSVTLDFENLVDPADICVEAVLSDDSPSGSILPADVTPIPVLHGKPLWITIHPCQEGLRFKGLVHASFNISLDHAMDSQLVGFFKASGYPGSLFELIGLVVPDSADSTGASTGGDLPSFSEFTMASIPVESLPDIIDTKLAQMWDTLQSSKELIEWNLFRVLRIVLARVNFYWAMRDDLSTIQWLWAFYDIVSAAEDVGIISDLYSSDDPMANAAGRLRAQAHQLIFLVNHLLASPDPTR